MSQKKKKAAVSAKQKLEAIQGLGDKGEIFRIVATYSYCGVGPNTVGEWRRNCVDLERKYNR